MPATVSIDRQQFDGLRHGDEHALERVFKDQYVVLTTEVRAELDDPAAAPKIVERAFLQAWQERTHFETPEALERFLHQSVHQGALREKGRRAALHRFEQHEGVKHVPHAAAPAPVPVEEAWRHVTEVLHAPPPDAAAAAHRRHDMSRHEAAAHVAKVGRRAPWAGPLVIGLVLGALALGGMRWADRSSNEVRVARALAAPEVRIRSTKLGERAAITLTDESKVVLGADTKLRIPPSFGEGMRPVGLEGSATFTVAADERNPFIVRAGEATLTAVGTAFDVRSYAGDGRVLLRVREGTVLVTVGATTETVNAGQLAAIANDGAISRPEAAAVAPQLAWADGRMIVENRPLRAALAEVQRWYGVTIETRGAPSLLDRPVSVNVELGSVRDVIAQLETTGNLKFDWDDKTMVLRDAAPTPKP